MASISSVGIGSGVLTSDLIDKLAAAEREPTELRITAEEEEVNAQLSELARLKSAASDLRLSARFLASPDAIKANTVTSSNSGITATATDKATLGTYRIAVTNLAQAHSLATGTFNDANTTSLGSGTIDITVGGTTKKITIGAANNTLQGIADSINSQSGLGATASVLNTGSGFQLILSANKEGAQNQITMAFNDADGVDDGVGLSQLKNGPGAFTEVAAAEDLQLSVNGIAVSRSSNTVDDLFKGMSFEFSEETSAPATVTVARDDQAVTDKVQDLVDKYNAMQEIIKETTKFDPSSGEGGVFLGESAIRMISQQSRGVLYGMVQGLQSAGVRSLADIGITTNRENGQLLFDQTRFKTRLKDFPDDVAALFAEQGRTTDSQVSYVNATVASKPGTYDIDITAAATQGAYSGTVDLSGGATIDAGNSSFELVVDGVNSGPITLSAGTYTAQALVTEMQNKLNENAGLAAQGKSIVVSLDANNRLVLSSGSFGSASTVNIKSVGANSAATLGLAVGDGTAGTDVAGTIGGQPATGTGRVLRANEGTPADGIAVDVAGSQIGSRGAVTYIEGVAEGLVDTVTNFLSFNGVLTSFEERLNSKLDELGEDRADLDKRVTLFTERLARQFSVADALVAQFKSTENFLTAQLAGLSGEKK